MTLREQFENETNLEAVIPGWYENVELARPEYTKWLEAKITSHNNDCAVPHPADATPKLPSLGAVKEEIAKDSSDKNFIERTYYAIQRLGNFAQS